MGPPPPSYDDAFETLARVAYRVAFRVLGDRDDASDVAQEAMARAYERWSKIAHYAEAWTAKVATNLAIGQWRRRRPRAELPDLARDGEDGATLDRIDLVARLSALPRRQREVLALRYLADLSEADVAAALGCSLGSVKRHSHRGLTALRLAHNGVS
jgi:RNA polymerase sigma factor (sigma-70 family)